MSVNAESALHFSLCVSFVIFNFAQSDCPNPKRNGKPPLRILDRPNVTFDFPNGFPPVFFRLAVVVWFWLRFIGRIIEQLFHF